MPDRVALIDRDRSITYADLDRLSENLALNLLELGLQPLDRVVVQLPNVAEFVILYFALQKIGAFRSRHWRRTGTRKSASSSSFPAQRPA